MKNWKEEFENKCESGHFKIGEIDKSLLVKFIESLLAEQKKEFLMSENSEWHKDELRREIKKELIGKIDNKIKETSENYSNDESRCYWQCCGLHDAKEIINHHD